MSALTLKMSKIASKTKQFIKKVIFKTLTSSNIACDALRIDHWVVEPIMLPCLTENPEANFEEAMAEWAKYSHSRLMLAARVENTDEISVAVDAIIKRHRTEKNIELLTLRNRQLVSSRSKLLAAGGYVRFHSYQTMKPGQSTIRHGKVLSLVSQFEGQGLMLVGRAFPPRRINLSIPA